MRSKLIFECQVHAQHSRASMLNNVADDRGSVVASRLQPFDCDDVGLVGGQSRQEKRLAGRLRGLCVNTTRTTNKFAFKNIVEGTRKFRRLSFAQRPKRNPRVERRVAERLTRAFLFIIAGKTDEEQRRRIFAFNNLKITAKSLRSPLDGKFFDFSVRILPQSRSTGDRKLCNSTCRLPVHIFL